MTLVERDTLKLEWRDGPPPKPWSDEWFIAETTYGDRVCLKALPEEWTYDFKTADDTYIKADRIKRWMQFPDSDYIAPNDPRIEQLEAEIARKDEALRAAVRAANLALFVIRKQGVMPNSSWEGGFDADMALALSALEASEPVMIRPPLIGEVR